MSHTQFGVACRIEALKRYNLHRLPGTTDESMIDQTISHYKITEKLGEGGMGVVYKAEDTKLKRAVALKFLAAHLLKDEEARKRFDREAQAAAALHHPNVCPIHEIAEADGRTFLAMAFIEGDTLDKRIESAPLKIPEALDVAQQIAKGVAAAHEKNIVHRDIKPGNVIIDEKGHVTVMDFGLALLTEGSKLTKFDMTLGTVAYMSPEQAEGAEVDHRTDIWALGCVLYETVCGQRPFRGMYDQALLYEIMHEEPEPLTGLRTGIPVELELLVNKCLAKNAGQRYQHADELVVDLGTLQEKLKSGRSTILRSQVASAASQAPAEPAVTAQGSVQAEASPIAAAEAAPNKHLRLYQALLAVTVIASLALAFAYFRQPAPEAPLRRFAITPAVDVPTSATEAGVAVSPNGKHIAYTGAGAAGKLWIRDLDQSQPRVLEGTDGAVLPFWSPDSAFVGFAAGGELKKVALAGGIPIRLCPLPSSVFAGGSWSADGQSIVFSSGDWDIYEVPARGDEVNLVIAKESDSTEDGPTGFLARPHFLPAEAGPRLLVYSFGGNPGRTLMVQDLAGGRREVLGPGSHPFYSSSGHLIYQSDLGADELWALPFSLSSLSAVGEAFPITQNGSGPTVATDQTLVYLDGLGQQLQKLAWFDRAGEKIGEIGSPQLGYHFPELSPRDQRVAVSTLEGGNRDVWIWEVSRGVKNRLTFSEATERAAVWSPTGAELAFMSNRTGNYNIFLRKADGSDEPRPVAAGPHNEFATDWSQDGRYLVYGNRDPETGIDIRYLERKGDGADWEQHPYLQTPYGERNAKLSPDGGLVVYQSNESGRDEIYVRPFPEGGGRTAVSTDGGTQPRWSTDGTEIFYVEGSTLVAVQVSTRPDFSVGSVTRLFEHRALTRQAAWPFAQYDVSADGRRFVFPVPIDEEAEQKVSIRVVENWYEEFRDREQD